MLPPKATSALGGSSSLGERVFKALRGDADQLALWVPRLPPGLLVDFKKGDLNISFLMTRFAFFAFVLCSAALVSLPAGEGTNRSDGIHNITCPKLGCFGRLYGPGYPAGNGREYECSEGHKVVIRTAY